MSLQHVAVAKAVTPTKTSCSAPGRPGARAWSRAGSSSATSRPGRAPPGRYATLRYLDRRAYRSSRPCSSLRAEASSYRGRGQGSGGESCLARNICLDAGSLSPVVGSEPITADKITVLLPYAAPGLGAPDLIFTANLVNSATGRSWPCRSSCGKRRHGDHWNSRRGSLPRSRTRGGVHALHPRRRQGDGATGQRAGAAGGRPLKPDLGNAFQFPGNEYDGELRADRPVGPGGPMRNLIEGLQSGHRNGPDGRDVDGRDRADETAPPKPSTSTRPPSSRRPRGSSST